MKCFDYGILNKEQKEELRQIIAKHFPGRDVKLNYDMFDYGLFIILEGGNLNKEIIYSDFSFASLGNIDLAVDYNMYFAKTFGEEYIEFYNTSKKVELESLDRSTTTGEKTYNHIIKIDEILKPKFRKILEETEQM